MKPEFSAASSDRILKIIYDFQLAHCANVAAHLDIAEKLYERPRSVEELAAQTGTHAPSLYRVLRVLAAEGLFEEREDRVFAFTPDAAAIHGDTEGSVKYYLQAILGEHAHAFGNLLYSTQTGKTAFDHYYNMDVWAYYAQQPERAANFNKAMAGLTQYYAREAVKAYDFHGYDTIVDVGGGNGALLFAILEAAKEARGVIFDASFVIPHTERLIAESPYRDRCSAVAGNFFESVPEGKDMYLLKYILHDWTDEDGVKILSNCARAMRPGSKVLVLEAVIPAGNDFHAGKYTDVTMLACTRGRERSAPDFKSMLREAGLKFNRIVDLPLDEISLIEGEKE